jgi:hypothetical protein
MDDLPANFPTDFPDHVRNRIQAGLLRVYSRWLEKQDLSECLRDSYDVYAAALKDAPHVLIADVLTEAIPGWVFDWAVRKKWLPYPPMRRVRPPAVRFGEPRPRGPLNRPVAESELTTTLGTYRMTDWYKADIMKRLASRIAYWQAETFMPAAFARDGKRHAEDSNLVAQQPRMSTSMIANEEATRVMARRVAELTPIPESMLPKSRPNDKTENAPPVSPPDSIGVQIEKLRVESRMSVEALADAIERDPTTVSRHISDKLDPQLRTLGAYERVFSKVLKRQIVITKTPVERQ